MLHYQAPLADYDFLLNRVFRVEQLQALPGFENFDASIVLPILEEASKFCSEVLVPLNHSGDIESCQHQGSDVRTPKGFKEAYDQFCQLGFPTLPWDVAYGGQALPKTLYLAIDEMLSSANLSFSLYPELTMGAFAAIYQCGSEALKNLYLPKLCTGEWSGTMCLTEAHAGTDLGMIKTKATPREDGSYSLEGSKIFITAGEHDLSQNIIHLVLARLPDAPKGVKGISLFLVPKFLVQENGKLGLRNKVFCGSIEDKMGIKASATCVMNFDGAQGWLLGQENQGLAHMFVMMNAARLGVGIQGLGIAEIALQNALAYAKDRVQGRSLSGVKEPQKPADSILHHPDVRRMILSISSQNMALRAMAVWCGMALDISKHHPDPKVCEENLELVQLLTPVIKSYFTDHGFYAAVTGQQVLGGHGFIKEYGMEQLVRDVRITQIYEGTNGIQALDLVGRKLPHKAGRALRHVCHPMDAWLEQYAGRKDLAFMHKALRQALKNLQQASLYLGAKAAFDPEEAGAASVEYLNLMAKSLMCFMWAKMTATAIEDSDVDAAYRTYILAQAKFYVDKILPSSFGHLATLTTGKDSLMNIAL